VTCRQVLFRPICAGLAEKLVICGGAAAQAPVAPVSALELPPHWPDPAL